MQAGTWLADGYYAVIWGFVGDHDYKRDCLGACNVNSNDPCSLCPANVTSCPWFDFRHGSEWVRRAYAVGDVDQPECVLYDTYGCDVDTNKPDWMHDKSLGTDKVLQGKFH